MTVIGLAVFAVAEQDWAVVVGERAAAVLATGTPGCGRCRASIPGWG